jgi:hypothetical protein
MGKFDEKKNFKNPLAYEYWEESHVWGYAVSRIFEEDGKLAASIANYTAVGYAIMAEELEPYNPQVVFWKEFISELAGASNEYLINTLATAYVKLKLAGEHGYDQQQADRYIGIVEFALNDLIPKLERGELWQN